MSITTAATRSSSAARTPEPAVGQQLYVAAMHKVRDRNSSAPQRWVPYGVEHAWQPGTRQTLCGEFTNGWTVFWERRFSAGHTQACPSCIEASLPAASRRRLDPMRSSVA